MNRNCEITRDLIPLCIDRAASAASEEFVKEHISGCPECRKIMEDMQSSLELPLSTSECAEQRKPFEGLKKLFSKKLTKAIVIAIAALVVCFCSLLALCRIELPVDPENVVFYEYGDHVWFRFDGTGELGWSADGRAETEGDISSTEWTFRFSQSLWDRYLEPIYDRGERTYCFESIDNVAKIYSEDGSLLFDRENHITSSPTE